MNGPSFPYDVFLSHRAKDKTVVRPLAERLRQDGLKVWFDKPESPVAASRQSAADFLCYVCPAEKTAALSRDAATP